MKTKRHIIILTALLIGAAILSAGMRSGVPSGRIGLVWDYPTNELSTNLWFLIRHTTNITIPISQWPVIQKVVGTNTKAEVIVTPGVNFFTATASNFWGESDFSDVAETPALPRSDMKLEIKRAE